VAGGDHENAANAKNRRRAITLATALGTGIGCAKMGSFVEGIGRGVVGHQNGEDNCATVTSAFLLEPEGERGRGTRQREGGTKRHGQHSGANKIPLMATVKGRYQGEDGQATDDSE